VLFKHRHPDDTPVFHKEIIQAWHSPRPRVITQAFRGGAKSTIAEEVVIIEALYSLFTFAMLLGESRDRAIERLRAIKHEIEWNDHINYLYGNLVGPTWNEDEIICSNGVRIMAFGMDQSMRGIKHLQARPDRLYGDDMESAESVKTPEAREAFAHKFMTVVYPLRDITKARVRILGTPLDKDAFVIKLARSSEWHAQVYPVEHVDLKTGARTPTWPARFPLDKIDEIKRDYSEVGMLNAYAQEYMLEPEDVTKKKFTEAMFKSEAMVRTWHPTIAIYDPARTTNTQTSATTGHVVGSWIGNKLVLWEGNGRFLMPDEIIGDLFRVQDEFSPILIGVEADGLNEFLMQPLRAEQTKRRQILPVKALKAPKGKLQFIESLQPFFKAGDIVFAADMPELKKQLLDFPRGRMDAPNALAYFLISRPGLPIFDGFSSVNVMEGMQVVPRAQTFLAVNTDGSYLTGVLAQYTDGMLRIAADWAVEGDANGLRELLTDAMLHAGMPFKTVLGPWHYGAFSKHGLVPAAAKIPLRQLTQGGAVESGREELRQRLRMVSKGLPSLMVGSDAKWTLNAFSGGYCKAVRKNSTLSDFAEEGVYKVLCEGLESFAALLQTVRPEDTDGDTPSYAYTKGGAKYMTALPDRNR
jgi:hypothetical protein